MRRLLLEELGRAPGYSAIHLDVRESRVLGCQFRADALQAARMGVLADRNSTRSGRPRGEETFGLNQLGRWPFIRLSTVFVGSVVLATLAAGALPAGAQINTRLLVESGTEVPGHSGLAFGPFLSVAMNGNDDIIFLTSMRSPRGDMHAVVRSTGVTFSVVAFQGLVGPYPRSTYDAFSAPSMNDSGVVAFTASLVSQDADVPRLIVVRQEGSKPRVVASNLDAPPGQAGTKFEEFSAPVVTSDGNLLFGARWSGGGSGSGLFQWSPRGLRALALPEDLRLKPKELLEPFFLGHDEAAFLRRGASFELATEQFFRAIAIQALQELQPPPDPGQTTELLAARASVAPVQMLLVFSENGNIQTALLAGDPSKPVMVRQSLSTTPVRPVGRILSVTIGPRGNLLFASAPADAPNDLALYCNCDGQAIRMTTPEDFLPITSTAPGKPVFSLSGDTQQTVVFIGPTTTGDTSGVYVTTIH
jgi:hypothetical protein